MSVHEVAQVVAAASPAGAAAVGVAVVVKLTRVVLLAPMVAGVSVVQRRRAATTGSRPPIVPLFVVGFLATMVLRTTGIVPAAVLGAGGVLTTLLFAAALFGLGSQVRLGALCARAGAGSCWARCRRVLVASVGLAALGPDRHRVTLRRASASPPPAAGAPPAAPPPRGASRRAGRPRRRRRGSR